MPKVLISDALSPAAVQIFKDRGLEVDFQPNLGKDKDKLAEVIGGYDGLAIRSATKVSPKILEKAKNLKVIGRAGIGVDNVDIPAATAKGVIVMNTPFGNSITTAEHAISLMLALARQIPEADVSTRAGKWEKNKFMGVEIFGKTLGVIGCGNIGSIVADRARRPADEGDRLRSVPVAGARDGSRRREGRARRAVQARRFHHAAHAAHREDQEHHRRGGAQADEEGRAHRQLRARRPGRRGGARTRRSRSGHVAGAAFDVFVEEPATAIRCSRLPNVVCTPHLGAATSEAQENVALQIAEQMSDYLLRGAISNAVNFPSITAEEAPRLKPFIALAEKLGSFAGQLTESGITKVQISYEGAVAQMKTKALTSAAIAGLLRPMLQDVNVVSAPIVAKERGIVIEETTREARGRLREPDHGHRVTTEQQTRWVSGTVLPTAGRASSTSRASAWTPSSAPR